MHEPAGVYFIGELNSLPRARSPRDVRIHAKVCPLLDKLTTDFPVLDKLGAEQVASLIEIAELAAFEVASGMRPAVAAPRNKARREIATPTKPFADGFGLGLDRWLGHSAGAAHGCTG
ncbi:MAG TPA: hypothetical protein VK522_22465 [Pseudolabrys sp.]|nr:hypothetical protein [Pseudolabrys sp.]